MKAWTWSSRLTQADRSRQRCILAYRDRGLDAAADRTWNKLQLRSIFGDTDVLIPYMELVRSAYQDARRAGVRASRLPGRDLVTTTETGHLAEIAQQPPQHALRLGVDPRNREHAITRGPQHLVLRDVDGELVVPDLQRQRQAVMDGTFGLPPQGTGDDRNEIAAASATGTVSACQAALCSA